MESTEDLKQQIERLKQQLKAVHYYADAECLYWLEKNYNVSRDNIVNVEYAGGHGYTICNVYMSDGNCIYVSEETYAGLLLAWFRYKKDI